MYKSASENKYAAQKQAESERFNSIILSYIQSIPFNKNREISVVDMKPTLKGLEVVYRICNSIQRFANTISYSVLAELTSKSKED